MNTNLLVDTLNKKANGSWFNAEWCSDLPLSAEAKKQGHIGYKITTAQCRKGIEYSTQKSVQEKVAHGYVLRHELPWGQWKAGYEGLILEHKEQEYVRLYFGPNQPKTKYYLDGKEVTYEELKTSGLVLKSFFNKGFQKPDCLSIRIANIQKIY